MNMNELAHTACGIMPDYPTQVKQLSEQVTELVKKCDRYERALNNIINHNEITGGEMAQYSVTIVIAKEALEAE